VAEILIPADQLQARIAELGDEISRDYYGHDLLLLSVLKGSVLFLTDLMRQITVPHAIDFMATSSYGEGQESSGVVRILKDLDAAIEGRSVLIVEDIIDTGATLDYLTRILRARQPRSLEICTLLNKPARREAPVAVKYVGFDIPDKFVFGYGLDFAELYRNLPYVAVLAPEYYRG
jgi:hypoxanthine phosphoribosyltransferase